MYSCKLCLSSIIDTSASYNWGQCRNCCQYIIWLESALISKEWIVLLGAHKYFEYEPKSKRAFLWLSLDQHNRRQLSSIEELTPQLAQQWLERLKLYVVMS